MIKTHHWPCHVCSSSTWCAACLHRAELYGPAQVATVVGSHCVTLSDPHTIVLSHNELLMVCRWVFEKWPANNRRVCLLLLVLQSAC